MEDTNPATIIRALSWHKDSLKFLTFDFCPRDEDEHFYQVPKLGSLEEFLRLQTLHVNQDCLPWEPLLPPSLETLGITSPDYPLEPDLFRNLAIASHSSLKSLSKLYIDCDDWPDGIFDGFGRRVYISVRDS